jgi:hypothetical protein
MTQYISANYGYRDIVKSDGTPVTPDPVTGYCTLVAGTTYYCSLGGHSAETPSETALVSAHVQGDAAIIAAISFQDSNNPARVGGTDKGQNNVTFFSSSGGDWITENPASAVVGTDGTGWTSSGAVVSAAGTGAGGAMFHVGNYGAKRARLKIVVGGTGGKLRVNVNGKVGA